MENLEFKKWLTGTLKPYGFRREKSNWYKYTDNTLVVLTIDKHPYCRGYLIDAGIEVYPEHHEKCPMANELDMYDMFIFPAQRDLRSRAYQDSKHFVDYRERPQASEMHIDLDVLSDEQIIESMNFNINKRLIPMLDIKKFKKIVASDIYFIQLGNAEKLPYYGVPEDMIKKYNVYCNN